MYHQIIDPLEDLKVNLDKFEQHLKYLQQNFHIIIPGQKILRKKISVCLTFDDAYADFYEFIYPLLKKLQIPSILGIPSGLIQDSTEIDINQRLAVSYPQGLNAEEAHRSPLCTWKEIKAMVSSGFVHPASHTHNHQNLGIISLGEAYEELCVSKRKILAKLEKIAETFIYPFGAKNSQVQNIANNHYQYVMRIGNSSNNNWHQKILYRIDADPFWKNNKKISFANLLSWKIKYWWNRIRGR
jgi:peptidoglycan/xylan/chitin deacetylase (PgdA/CDA1 family)